MNNCSILDCEKKVVARGWCDKHYKRWQINGDPLYTEKPIDRICSVEGCDNKHRSIGLCSKHERRFRRNGHLDVHLKKYNSFIEAYLDQVITNGLSCWEWTGSKNPAGYGLVFYKNEIMFIHRFSYMHFVGEIEEGNFICHHCDNPICSNPKHLFQGTNQDNIQDCIRKGRFKRAPDLLKAKGSKVAGSKLTEAQVFEIKKMIKEGKNNTEIAGLFNVTHGNISSIRLGKTWKHVGEDHGEKT